MSEIKFLRAKDMSASIDNIIREAKKQLYIISPYIRLDGNVKKLLSDESHLKDVDAYLVYRDDKRKGKVKDSDKEVAPETVAWLASRPWIKTSHLQNLHAKCYLNEKRALVASLNLTGGAMINNVEMGILVSKGNFFTRVVEIDSLYEDILKEVNWIVRHSEDVTTNHAEEDAETHQIVKNVAMGFCINCGEETSVDPGAPYCKRHIRYWNQDKNNEREMGYCHLCGKKPKRKLTRLKPACYPCYKKNKDIYEWPAA